MKKILVPTDFSDGAQNALHHAIEIAKKIGASIEVLHTYSTPPTGTAVMVDITDILKKNAKEELSNLRDSFAAKAKEAQISIKYDAEHGTVVDGINRAVEEGHIDLVVMGTKGTSGTAEKWLGSNTAAAAKNINVPLIAVPSDLPFAAFKRIVFTTDLKTVENSKSLEFLGQLSNIFESHIRFLHIQKEGEKIDPSAIEAYKHQMKSVFGKEEIELVMIVDSDIDDAIEDELESHPADLVVTVRHQYGFFERLFRSSVSQKLINDAEAPILIIKG